MPAFKLYHIQMEEEYSKSVCSTSSSKRQGYPLQNYSWTPASVSSFTDEPKSCWF